MLEQVTMIEKVREVCEQDERVMGALMYGSFALGQGDRFSDIEFYLFFQDRVLDEVDEEAWVAQIAPVELYYTNEFGNGTAVFENLVRGEFRFEKASNIDLVEWEMKRWLALLRNSAILEGPLDRLVRSRGGFGRH